MQIAIRKNGNDEMTTYTVPYISGLSLRKALELRDQVNLANLSVEDVNKLAEFTVQVFKEQFTVEELLEGLSSDELPGELDRVFKSAIMGEKGYEDYMNRLEEDRDPKNKKTPTK